MGRRYIDRAAVPRNKTITDWDDIIDETLFIIKFEGIDDGEVLHCIGRSGEAIEVLGQPKKLSQIIRKELGSHAVKETKRYRVTLVKDYMYYTLKWKGFEMEITDDVLPCTYSTPGTDYDEYRRYWRL